MMSTEEYRYVLRNDLMSFAERAFRELNPTTPFVMGDQFELMAARLGSCHTGDVTRLIVNLPPRSFKTLLISVGFVAWHLGHRPDAKIICVSYGQDLAEKNARDTRNLMNSAFYKALFPTRLAPQRMAVNDFETTGGGGRMATSVGGVLTGRGADLIIIDDPLKPSEALWDSQRNAVNDWFDNSLLSRLNDKKKGCIIIVMQRLHQDDLVGHVLEQNPNWNVLSFPAIATADEAITFQTPFGPRVYRRRQGEALHPERESLETLATMRKAQGEYNFESQYQQAPTPIGGFMVKTVWLKSYIPGEQPGRFDRIVQSWDTANKAAELNDYSVCTTWGVVDGRFYLLDVFRQRLNYPDLRRATLELANRFKADTIVIEDKASGTQLIQDMQQERLYGVHAYKPPPNTDKQVRLHMQTTFFENGKVFLPRDASWLAEYVAEITGFPGTKFDDQVDSTTQALAYLREPDELEIWRRLGRQS
jgi:predicted phage terminase large subunit-like protein